MDKDIQTQPQGADGGDTGLSALFGQQSGNQVSQPASVEADESNGSPQYVTRKDLDQVRQDAINEARKTAQAISDKAASVSKKAYQAAMAEIDRLKGMGIPMTPDQEQKIRDQKLDEAIKQETGGEQAQPHINNEPIPPQEVEAQPIVKPSDWLKDKVDALIAESNGLQLSGEEMTAAGLTPEMMRSSEGRFFETYQAALTKKKQGEQPGRGFTPGFGTGGNAVGLEANYRKEIMAARGNKSAIQAIRNKYQAQGLNTSQVNVAIE